MTDSPIIVRHKDLAELVVKQQGIREGYWGLFIRFGIQAANIPVQLPNSPQISLLPAAVLPILEIGIQEFPELNDLSVDAAVVNPAAKRKESKTTKAKKK